MEKFKQIYEDGKIFIKDEPILFINPYTEHELQKIYLFEKPTVLYDNVKGFKENIKFINKILKRKIKVISFKSEILVHIKSIRKIKKSTIGIYSEDTFVDKEKLTDVYNLDISNLPSYFKNYQNPLIILDATDDTDIVEILKNRKNYPTFLLSSDNTNILQHLVLEDYTDNTCIFKKCCISNYLLNKKERIKRFFGMEEEETDGYLVYFGCFEDKDYNKIMSFDGVVFLYWFGMDCNINNKKVRKMLKSLSKKSNIIHFVFSENLRDVLMK